MKVTKYVIRLCYTDAGFFACYDKPGFLSGLKSVESGIAPVFGGSPVLHSFSSAMFMQRELRRTGYCVQVIPFWVIMLIRRIRALLGIAAARKAARDRWKK